MTSSVKSVEAEGETIDEAIANALATLGIPRERVQVEILNDARRGVLGFGGQRARVRVSPREGAPAASAEPTGARRREQSPKRPSASFASFSRSWTCRDNVEDAPVEEAG